MAKTLQQKLDFKGIGMNAYNRHKGPNDEMKAIWKIKKELIDKILKKHGGKRSSYESLTPEKLELILKEGTKDKSREDEYIRNSILNIK